MSIAIDFTESARDQALLGRPVPVVRQRSTLPAAAEEAKTNVCSLDSPKSRQWNQTLTLALQPVCTLIMVAAWIATLILITWLFLDFARSAMDQLFSLSTYQILHAMAGR